MSKHLKPTEGDGKDLCDLLRERLSIPDSVKWFEVRFAAAEPVTVRCEYTAEALPLPPEEPEPGDAPAPSQNYGGLDG